LNLRDSGALFEDNQLADASFANAKLDNSLFFDVDLSGVNELTPAQLEAVFGDSTVKLPPSVRRPTHWDDRILETEERGALILDAWSKV
jgi:hypothetical protein